MRWHRNLGKTTRRRRRGYTLRLERLEVRNLFAGLDDLPVVEEEESEKKDPVEESTDESAESEVVLIRTLMVSEDEKAPADDEGGSSDDEVVEESVEKASDEESAPEDGEVIMYTMMSVGGDEGDTVSDEEVLDDSSEEIPIRYMMRGAEDGGEESVDGEIREEESSEVVDSDELIYMTMTGVVDESGDLEVTDRSLEEDSGEPVDDSEVVYFGGETSEEEVLYTLSAAGRYDWYNDSEPLDTNGDGSLSPIDVLLVLEALDRSGSTELSNSLRPNALYGEETGGAAYYLDGNDDTYLSPIDVLLRVNYFTDDTAEAAILDSGRLMADPTGEFDDSSDTSLAIIADDSLGLVADESGDEFWDDADLDGARMAMPVDDSESVDEGFDSKVSDDYWGEYSDDADGVLDEELVDLLAE